ncbi:MAG: alpha-amylase, partial [Bacteroidales bacterium]|nr:alpha-amylase [Bacteroidales bacterium]MBQ9702751.1 alpha-amylase [Bacteroidales bacterium]
NYAWELHHLLNGLAQGRKTVAELKDYVARDAEKFPKEAFRLSFTSNHDENSWSGTEFEREGIYADACAVLCFTLPGTQPLIYTGQEIGLNRRLAFFEKDPITDWTPNEYTSFWKGLVDLKHQNAALAAGERGGELNWWEVTEGIVAFSRTKGKNQVIVIANFGKEAYTPVFNLPGTVYTNHFTGEKVEGPVDLSLAPGEYVVLTK